MSVRVELELDDGSFTTRMVHAGESVRQFQQNVGQGIQSVRLFNEQAGSMLGTLRDLTVTLGMARAAFENVRGVTSGWAGDIIKVNAEMEKLSFLLRGMSNAADPVKDAANQVKFLRDAAKDAPFSLKELTDTFVKMKATGIDPMAGGFKAMVDGVAAFGGTDEVLKRATVAISQMAGKGVIQMEELRQQLGEAMPRAVEIMARSMGITTGQLIQDIGKGTLEAKNALANFFVESERTFGGAAAQQMQTFNGRLSQTNTLMQGLALETGKAGFFDAVKNQLADLNHFLGGAQAQQFAQMLGQGLTSVVGTLRQALDVVLQFKNEIFSVGEVIAVAFAGKAAMSGLLGIGNMLTNVAAQTRAFSMTWVAMDNTMRMADMGRTLNIVTNGAMGLSAMGYAARFASQGITLLGAGLAFVSNVAIPIVGTLITVAMAFGLFSNKAEEAYENLVKYGAQTRKEAEAGDAYVKQLEKRIEAARQLAEISKNSGSGDAAAFGGGSYDEEVKKGEAKLAEAKSKTAEAKQEAAKREAASLLQVYNENLANELFQVSKGYDEQGKAADKAYADERARRIAANQDTSVLDANHAREHQQRVIDSIKEEFQLRQNRIEATQVLMQEGNDKVSLIGGKFINEQIKAQGQLQAQQLALENSTMGVKTLDKPVDIQKLLERSKALIDSTKEDIVGMQAEAGGANSELAKLIYRIEDARSKSQTLGPQENSDIKTQIEDLKQVTVIREQQAQQLAGQKKLDGEIEGIATRARQALLEAQSAGKSGFDKLWAGMKEGAYSGLNPLQQMLKSFSDSGKDAAGNLKTLFGAEMLNDANAFMSVTQQIAAHFGVIASGANELGATVSKGIRVPGLTTGGSSFNGKNYFDNLMGAESGGNPNAANPNSSARGLGQFTKGTWLDFLKTRPDITGTDEQKLAMRSDRSLTEDAVIWRNSQTAAKLGPAGIPTNDANMYLGHFLGPDGALAALSKSSDTMLRSIPELTKAIETNPKVFDRLNTVGDLQNWAANTKGMGTAFTARTNRNDPRDMAGLLSGVGGPDSAQGRMLSDALVREQMARLQAQRNAGEEHLKQLSQDRIKAMEDEDGKNKKLAETRTQIRLGNFGPNLDPDHPDNKRYLDAARSTDQSLNTQSEATKDRAKLDATIEAQEKQLKVFDERMAELNRQLTNGGKFGFSGKTFQTISAQETTNTLVDKNVALGKTTPEEAQKVRDNAANAVRLQKNQEIMEAVQGEQQKTRAIENSLLTTSEARDREFQANIRREETYLALYQGNGQQRELLEQQVTRNIAALRRQQFDLTPIGGMLKTWRDYSNNLEQASTGWMNSFNDKLADMVIHGQASFRGLVQTIEKDIITLSLKAAESKLFSSILGFGGMGMGGAAATAGVDGLAAIHHTGGVAGSIMPYRSVPMSMFASARRFHTGSMGQTISGDEIPIIAKKGEQVDWPANLAKQYGGSGGGNFSMGDINVHGATNGSPAQNRDLAMQIQAHVKEAAGQMIGQEIRTQMRPGGQLHAMIKG